MPNDQRFIALVLSLSFLVATLQLVRARKLREEYALLWLAASVLLLFLSLFPDVVKLVAAMLGVVYAPTLVVVLTLLFALAIMLSHTAIITNLANHKRDLAQSVSLLEWQLRRLEASMVRDSHPANGNDRSRPRNTLPDVIVHAESAPEVSAERGRPGRVLVIGLDGATFDLIEPWARDGYLPTLARLMREGAYGRLRSTIPPMTAPAWTSFATGTNPGKHGLFDWIARKPGSYRFSPVTALDCKSPSLYSLLSDAGRRVCVLNVPMTYPPLAVNGAMVSGMPAPNTWATISYPPQLYDEMLQAVGDYILYPDPGSAYSDAGVDAFLRRLYRSGELRIRAFDYLRGLEKWDFAMAVFNGTDTVSHAMWKYFDPTHPLHDARRAEKYGGAIRDYYQFVDSYLAQVVERLDADTTLVIMSDHGFGPFHKFIHVNNLLIQVGLMGLRSRPSTRLKAALFNCGFAPMNVYDVLMRLGLGALKREVVRGNGQGLLKTFFLSFDDVDWSHTKAYSLGNIGQINLNVIGREPMGCVHPGSEYERVRDEIIAQLGELRDPETGETVVEATYRREEVYSGEHLDSAPDILFIPRRLEYFGFGEYEFGSNKVIEAVKRGISGTHRMDGVFLAYGRGVEAGLRIDAARIVDLAPTMMFLMGEPVPEHMDGRVLHEMLREGFQPVRAEGRSMQWRPGATDVDGQFTAEEEQLLAERLRSLGYVG